MTDLFQVVLSPPALYLLLREDISQGKGWKSWAMTYAGIVLKDLAAAIKSFWFETARQIICAFFLGNEAVRIRYT